MDKGSLFEISKSSWETEAVTLSIKQTVKFQKILLKKLCKRKSQESYKTFSMFKLISKSRFLIQQNFPNTKSFQANTAFIRKSKICHFQNTQCGCVLYCNRLVSLPLSYIKLKNGQTYFINLTLFTPQDFLKHVWPFCNIMH